MGEIEECCKDPNPLSGRAEGVIFIRRIHNTFDNGGAGGEEQPLKLTYLTYINLNMKILSFQTRDKRFPVYSY